MLHVVHPLVPDLRVQAHRRCWQVWIFHCSVLPVPQRAMSCSLQTCCFIAGKVRNLINKVRSRVGRARPPGLLIPPDIRVLMNVLSWSREYYRKLSPPASPALELPRLPDVTFPGERSDSCRSAGGSQSIPPVQRRGECGQGSLAILPLPLAAAIPLTPTPRCLRSHRFHFILEFFE